jgi:polynucleotide 5'-hydroxyl-kinase GRC3/NOL9
MDTHFQGEKLMNRTVEKNKTLLVEGPASVIMISGKAQVFGSPLTNAKIVIREGKRLPIAVEEKAEFDISSGQNAIVEEVDGNTVPSSWDSSCDELRNIQTKPIVAMILGAVDSGKSSFCTYLVNKQLLEKCKVTVLDGDLGQSDIGPPCTVAYAPVTRRITDLFSLHAKNAFFVGVTSPAGAINKVIEGLSTLKKELLEANPDVVVINTDGWIEGEDATYYKIKLVEELNPDIIFFIQQKDELMSISNALEKFKKVIVESPGAIRQRSSEKRRNLRELGYIKYLRNAKVQSYPLGWLQIEENETFGLGKRRVSDRYARQIYDLLGMKPLHFTENNNRISIIIGKKRWIKEENLQKVEEFTKKKAVVIRKGEEEGLLIAIYNSKKEFLGIGILQEIDYLRKAIKILTPVSEEASIVTIGAVKLDKNMKELPYFSEESRMEQISFSKPF